jgi:RNA polymerase sigma factor (sigma-70 family)
VILNDRKAFVADIELRHGKRLRQFFARRLRGAAADTVPDLAQETFLRLLRVDRHETIRSGEAYLFTIALHVFRQHTLRRAAVPESVEIDALANEVAGESADDPLAQAEIQQRLAWLQSALRQLSPKARTTLLLHRRDGYTLEEIGAQLGISRAMAVKYLGQALAHCRKALQDKARQDVS